MNDYLKKVEEFTQLCGNNIPDAPEVSNKKVNELRIKLIREELDELEKALNENNVVETLDALCDLQYVLSGAILELGFSDIFDKNFELVDTNNKTKFHTDYWEAEKTQKSYFHRNIGPVIESITVNNVKYYVVKNKYGKVLKPYNYESVKLNLNK